MPSSVHFVFYDTGGKATSRRARAPADLDNFEFAYNTTTLRIGTVKTISVGAVFNSTGRDLVGITSTKFEVRK